MEPLNPARPAPSVAGQADAVLPARPAPGAVSLPLLCRRVAEAPAFQFAILAVIVANAAVLGLETSGGLQARFAGWFRAFSLTTQAVFTVEILIRMTAFWPRPARFFRDGWNTFDFAVVAIAYVPATGGLSNLARLARIIRVTRLVSALPDLRLILETLIRSIPSIGHIVVLLGVFVYAYAIAGFQLFATTDPDHWGTLGAALLTLFQVLTLEGWHEVHDGVSATHPFSWLYFTSFIVVAVMVMANLAVAVIINSLEAAKRADAAHPETGGTDAALARIEEIREALLSLETAVRTADPPRSGADARGPGD